MASGDAVQQIKDRLNIIDVISPYAELTKSGRHFVARCPFHSEKSPSFHVSPERGTYHCFGCGVGGDIFSFIQAIDGVEFKDALKTLAERAGVELVPENPQKKTERDELVAVIEAATSYYENQLPNMVDATAYLERRGVTKETIKKWRIGYAPGPPLAGWRELKTHLINEKFLPGTMLKAGLIKSAEGGKEPFDTFRDRIMFPLRDQAGRVVGFSGRILAKDTDAPKYVNSPETELYHKSELLYGYDMAKHGIRNLGFWIIVEGQFDVVMSHQAGYTNTVAVSGTALTLHHVQLLERLSTKVVLALDSDKAGIAAMKKSADLMLRRGIDVKVAAMPDGADPADMILADPKSFKTAVGHAVHIIEFLLAHLRKENADDRAYKLKATAEVMPFITLIPNMIDRDHFEGVTATALGTTKDAVHAEVLRLLEEQKRQPVQYKEVTVEKTPTPQNETMTAILRKEGTLHYLLAALTIVPEPVREVLEREIAVIVSPEVLESERINGSAHISKLTFQIEQFIEKSSYRLQIEEFTHKLNQLHKLTVEGKLAQEKAQLKEIESSGQGDTMPVLLRVNELRRQLQANEYQVSIFPKL
ncbi:DNA primase [Patescibacteria group bacterium]|nr:DNA primase [Patescibacteria group bacterium]